MGVGVRVCVRVCERVQVRARVRAYACKRVHVHACACA